jgi:hypothetical protein
VVTSVLSQSFERPDGFPTVVEAGSGHARSQRRTKWFVMAGVAAVAVTAVSVAATRKMGWPATLTPAIAQTADRPAPTQGETALAPTASVAAPLDPPEPAPTVSPPPIISTTAKPDSTPAKPDSTTAKKVVATSSSASKARANPPPTPPRPKPSKCQPYITDAEGVRVYNTECLKQQQSQ